MLKENRGYSLVELIVVMAIFVIVIAVASAGFMTVLNQVGQQSKQMETDIGSVVGLEVFRSDLQNVGYGIPWTLQNAPGYTEVGPGDSGGAIAISSLWPTGMSPGSFNDTGGVPRAVQSADTNFNLQGTPAVGSKYLVLKSLTVAGSSLATQKKWKTVTFSDTNVRSAPNWGDPIRDFTSDERVIVLRNTFSNNVPSRELEVNKGTGGFSTTFSLYSTLTVPHSSGDVFQVYGVDQDTNLRMPFNRADYYVSASPTSPPPACAPHTGVLYKAVLSQTANGGFKTTALMDCVADMQVVYGLGPAGSDEVNFHQTSLGTMSASDIRQQVKEIRVYILAQVGKKDTGFTYPSSSINVGESFAGTLQGRTFDLTQLGADWSKYRWKVYSIVVRPQNLIQ